MAIVLSWRTHDYLSHRGTLGMWRSHSPLLRWVMASLVLLVLVTLGVRIAHAAPGDLDPTFGVGGKVTTGFGGDGAMVHDLVLQPDGKLVATGWTWRNDSPTTQNSGLAMARYNPDGSLDTSFGSGGTITTYLDLPSTVGPYALVLQPDGKLVVGGVSWSSDFGLARYSASGTLDPTFGTGGTVTTIIGQYSVVNALALQPDGKLVAAGHSTTWNGSSWVHDFALARYNPDSSLDPAFGVGGIVTTDLGGSDEWALALALQPDGKLVVAGHSAPDFALARYNPDGSLDTSFGSGGHITTHFGSSMWGDDLALALQPDGKLVVAGPSRISNGNGTIFACALARYNPNGDLDPTFGLGGKVTTSDGFWPCALVLQPDGKLMLAGGSFALTRYNSDGSLDMSFGSGGVAVTPEDGSQADAFALVLQPDGKLVAGGWAWWNGASELTFALARYEGGGGDGGACTPLISIPYPDNSGAFGAYEGIVTDSDSSGNKTNVVFDIKGTTLELIGLPDRTLSFWASINDIEHDPSVVTIETNHDDVVGAFFADRRLIAPGTHASFVASFCKPGEATFTIGFSREALTLTVADSLISRMPVISDLLSVSKLAKFVNDLNAIPLYSSAMNHVGAAVDALFQGKDRVVPREIAAAGRDLLKLARNKTQRTQLRDAYAGLGIDVTVGKIVIALTGAPATLIKLSADLIALNVATGFGSEPITVKLIAPF